MVKTIFVIMVISMAMVMMLIAIESAEARDQSIGNDWDFNYHPVGPWSIAVQLRCRANNAKQLPIKKTQIKIIHNITTTTTKQRLSNEAMIDRDTIKMQN